MLWHNILFLLVEITCLEMHRKKKLKQGSDFKVVISMGRFCNL